MSRSYDKEIKSVLNNVQYDVDVLIDDIVSEYESEIGELQKTIDALKDEIKSLKEEIDERDALVN